MNEDYMEIIDYDDEDYNRTYYFSTYQEYKDFIDNYQNISGSLDIWGAWTYYFSTYQEYKNFIDYYQKLYNIQKYWTF